MTAASPRAFFFSAALHGAAAALLAWFTIVASRQIEQPKVFELVAGEGDNFGAKEAPALGVAGGVKLDVPQPDIPAPKPEPIRQEAPPPKPEPVAKLEPAPVLPLPEPVPVQKQDTKKAPEAPKQPEYNFKKQIQRTVIRAESKAKKEVAKERAAEAKRLEDEKKRLTKEQFDQMNKAKSSSPTTKVASSKGPRIDAEGIAKGVVGGSTANKTGGAGGKALTSDNDDVILAYFTMFKQRLRERFEPPPGISDTLKVTVEVRSHADGSFSSARVARSSGSRDFDQAVLDTIKRVRMPARPDKKTETVEFVFSMRDANEG